MGTGCAVCVWAHPNHPVHISEAKLGATFYAFTFSPCHPPPLLYRVPDLGSDRVDCDLSPHGCAAGEKAKLQCLLSCCYHCTGDKKGSICVRSFPQSLTWQQQCYSGERTECSSTPSTSWKMYGKGLGEIQFRGASVP